MAHIRQRPTGSQQVLFRVDGVQRSATFASYKDALAFSKVIDRLGGRAALDVLDAQAGIGASIPTVTELARTHVAALDGVTAGTRRDYERLIDRRIADQPLGELPVTVVTVDHVRAWQAYLEAAGLAAKTRRNHHAFLSAVLTTAIEQQLRGTNPAKGIRIKSTAVASSKVFLSAGEFAVLAGAIDAHYFPLLVALAGTGLRWGEVTALTVGDVDLDADQPVVHVTKAWKRTGKAQPVLGPPKSRAGVRTVPLAPEVADTIRILIDGRPSDALVFTAKEGGRVRNDHFHAREWGPTLRRLNTSGALRKRPRVHDLRHSYASSQIAAGVDLLSLRVRMGHESITTTVDTYGHLAPGAMALGAAASSLYLRQTVPEVLEIEG